MSASWKFDVVDLNGNPLTEGGLTLATNIELNFQMTQPNTFTCSLPLTAPEAQLILSDLTLPFVKGYRTPSGGNPDTDQVLQFYGPVWVDQVIGQNGIDQLMIGAFEPTIILNKRYALNNYAASDLGAIIKSEIDRTNTTDGETGIRTNSGNISASSSIDLINGGNTPTIQSLIEQFANQLDGCEIWTVPIELSSGKICDLYASSSRGSSSDVVFGYGDTSYANCSAMGRTRDKSKMVNVVNGYTDTLTSQKSDATSVAEFRALVEYMSFTGETTQSALDARAQGRLDNLSTPSAVAEYSCSPVGGDAAPQFFDDFGIGDDVYLHFVKGIEWGISQRVFSTKIGISQGGVENVTAIGFRP